MNLLRKSKYVIIWVIALLVLTGGIFFILRGKNGEHSRSGHAGQTGQKEILYYTCGMHPSVNVSPEEYEQGKTKCPICNMDLVPVHKEAENAEQAGIPQVLKLSRQGEYLAGVQTDKVEYRHLVKEIRTAGKFDYDERKLTYAAAWVEGRVDRLYVDFTGAQVKKGDPLALIYSPDLVSTQEEYILALKALDEARDTNNSQIVENSRSLAESTKKRLLLWGIPEDEIQRLKEERKANIQMTIYSPVSGAVVKKTVTEGEYVKKGAPLYMIADLSNLWMFADVYEYEMSWVRLGQKIEVTTPAYPDEIFVGTLTFIEPVLNPKTRSVKIRADFPNPKGKLKPEMFVNAGIKIDLTKEIFPHLAGAFKKEPMAEKGIEINTYKCGCSGKTWTQRADEKKSCPYCGEAMPDCGELIFQEKKMIAGSQGQHGKILAIPITALLDSGQRKLVYVYKGNGEYEPREVKVGPLSGKYYPVIEGLKEGEDVVTRGNFLIDSQSRLTGQEAAAYDAALGQEEGRKGHSH